MEGRRYFLLLCFPLGVPLVFLLSALFFFTFMGSFLFSDLSLSLYCVCSVFVCFFLSPVFVPFLPLVSWFSLCLLRPLFSFFMLPPCLCLRPPVLPSCSRFSPLGSALFFSLGSALPPPPRLWICALKTKAKLGYAGFFCGFSSPVSVSFASLSLLPVHFLSLFLWPSVASIKPENGFSSRVRASWSWGTNASVSLRRNRGRKFALLCLVRFPVLFLFSSPFFFFFFSP